MVKTLIIWVLWMTIITPLLAQNKNYADILTVHISLTEKQLGQYFRVTINYTGKQNIENLNLDSWRENFAIIHTDEYKDEDINGRIVQVLKLRIYPRFIDTNILPSLSFGKAKSTPIPITINPTHIKNSPIKLKWEISTLSPWQREAVIIRIQLQSSDTTAHVKLEPSENNNIMLRTLDTEKQTLENGQVIFNAGWVYYPSNAGQQSIELPAIRYQLSGSDRRRFYLPLQHLQVNTLPSYLPPNLPVGKLQLQSHIDNSETKAWNIIVRTPALLPYGVPSLDKQLSIINADDISNIKVKYEKNYRYYDYGDLNIINAPLPKWLSPFGPNININLRYFDPESGMLKDIKHSLPRHWNMPQWAWWITFIFCLLFSLIIFNIINPWLRHQADRWQLRKQLETNMTPNEIRKRLLNNGQYSSLQDWAKSDINRKNIAKKINRLCFSKAEPSNFLNLQADLLKLI